MKEKYNFEDAANEANALQKKVESGEADSYSGAEEQFERAKNTTSPDKLVPGFNMDGLVSPKLGLYASLQRVETYNFDQEYSDYVIERMSRLDAVRMEELRSVFQDKVFVDIGAGDNTNGHVIAGLLQAKGYIAVEPHNYQMLYNKLLRSDASSYRPFARSVENKKLPPFTVVAEGAERFLSRLPDNSVSLFASGVDESILGKLSPREYKRIETEMARVIAPGGAYMGFMSVLAPENMTNDQIAEFLVYKKEL